MDVNSLNPIRPVIPSVPAQPTQSTQDVASRKTNEIPKPVEQPVEDPKKSEENLNEAVDKLNKTANVFDRALKFQIHDETHRTVVSVVDTANDKVIRQYPSEEVLDMVAKMENYLGMIFDKKA